MKAIVISDTHGKHEDIKYTFKLPYDADMIIHAGDVSNVGELWDINAFIYWFSNLHYEYKIFIAGNHDFEFEYNRAIVREFIPSNVIYLEDSGIEIEGIKFWGSPVTPPFQNWAFGRDTDKITNHWNMIPDDTDVLITHSAPYGICDVSRIDYEHAGCPYLAAAVKNRIKPRYHIFGHVHYGYGIEEHEGITYINACLLNERYRLINEPIIIPI